jgi:F-type H+-transporting ATPase subunit delta
MKTIKQVKREARYLFQLCRVNGSLDEARVRHVVQRIVKSKRRGRLALATQFERLVKLDRLSRTAEVESVSTLSDDLKANIVGSLQRLYGPAIDTAFLENPNLIGGVRIRVGSDLYDGSIRAGLVALEKRFGSLPPNGSDTESE